METIAPSRIDIAPALLTRRPENVASRLKVLMLAEVANPEFVSVPLIAWCLTEAIARRADVHLVTHIRNRDAIVRQGWREGDQFTTIDTEWATRRIIKLAGLLGGRDNKGWTIHQALAPLGCLAFEMAMWRMFGGALKRGEYDLVHRLTPMSPTTPSMLAPRLKRLGVPLVVGPWNGGVPWPAGFGDRRQRERESLSRLRGAFKLVPGYRSLRRDSAAILAGSLHTLGELPESAAGHSFYLPENGIDPDRFSVPRSHRAGTPLRGAFVGRLVPYKAADILLRAAADLLRGGRLHLDIVGDGPERDAIAAQIAALGLQPFVTVHGNVEHRRVQDIIAQCDFLACPSIREFGGGVVLEAMALGVAPIVADYGGQTELIDERCGIRVPFSGPGSLETGFRDVLERVVTAPAILDDLGAAAMQRVRDHFTWDRKAEQIVGVYGWTRHGGARPVPIAMPPMAGRSTHG